MLKIDFFFLMVRQTITGDSTIITHQITKTKSIFFINRCSAIPFFTSFPIYKKSTMQMIKKKKSLNASTRQNTLPETIPEVDDCSKISVRKVL